MGFGFHAPRSPLETPGGSRVARLRGPPRLARNRRPSIGHPCPRGIQSRNRVHIQNQALSRRGEGTRLGSATGRWLPRTGVRSSHQRHRRGGPSTPKSVRSRRRTMWRPLMWSQGEGCDRLRSWPSRLSLGGQSSRSTRQPQRTASCPGRPPGVAFENPAVSWTANRRSSAQSRRPCPGTQSTVRSP